MTNDLVVILTALNLEYDAVRSKLVDPYLHRHGRGTRFEVGTLRGTNCRAALGVTGKGNHSAAVLAERAITEFSPVAVLFVGVAGALWDTPLGDVVMATNVYAYQGGTSEDDGLKARPKSWEIAHGVYQVAAHLARSDDWAGGRPPGTRAPRVHLAPIAAGEVVHNSRISAEAQWVRKHYNDAVAIEMEAAGVAQAGHLNGSPVAIVRGISDRADGTKTTREDDKWQPRAAANAAAFAVRLADELVKEREHIVMHEGNADKGAVTNIASGPVGIQAVNVMGSTVWMGSASHASAELDLVAELKTLRDALSRVRSAGRIDTATYEAAQDELDIAGTALDTSTPTSGHTFVLALKRLRGLIAEVADLATKVAALIVAAKGLW